MQLRFANQTSKLFHPPHISTSASFLISATAYAVSLPAHKVSITADTISLPADTVSLPADTASLPADTVSVPAYTVSITVSKPFLTAYKVSITAYKCSATVLASNELPRLCARAIFIYTAGCAGSFFAGFPSPLKRRTTAANEKLFFNTGLSLNIFLQIAHTLLTSS